MLHGFWEELLEVVQHDTRRVGCHEPFCSGIVEVLQDDVDTNQGSWPAKTVEQVHRHGKSLDGGTRCCAVEVVREEVVSLVAAAFDVCDLWEEWFEWPDRW